MCATTRKFTLNQYSCKNDLFIWKTCISFHFSFFLLCSLSLSVCVSRSQSVPRSSFSSLPLSCSSSFFVAVAAIAVALVKRWEDDGLVENYVGELIAVSLELCNKNIYIHTDTNIHVNSDTYSVCSIYVLLSIL